MTDDATHAPWHRRAATRILDAPHLPVTDYGRLGRSQCSTT